MSEYGPPPQQGYPGYPQGQYPPTAPYQQYPQGGYVPPGFVPQQHGPVMNQPQSMPTNAPNFPQGYANPPPYSQPGPMTYPQGGYIPPGYVPPQQGPIVQQPGSYGGPPSAGGWMNIPQGLANCPPGLEYLSTIDQLLVHQKVELLEVFTGFETNNKFTIKNNIGQKVYHAVEDTDCLTRNCCGPMRPFEMKILDNFGNQVINMHRPLACESCCFPCCLQTMEVTAPPGTPIGSIEQEWSIFSPSYLIKNERGEVVLRISGPMCRYALCGPVEFKVLAKDGETVVGRISKQWSGLLREMFTDADYFGIEFPLDLDVKVKAVLLGALFLIDAMFFEKSGNRETDGLGMI